jgi:hypothetical protein
MAGWLAGTAAKPSWAVLTNLPLPVKSISSVTGGGLVVEKRNAEGKFPSVTPSISRSPSTVG